MRNQIQFPQSPRKKRQDKRTLSQRIERALKIAARLDILAALADENEKRCEAAFAAKMRASQKVNATNGRHSTNNAAIRKVSPEKAE